jgi:hypothetical protein
MIDLELFAFYTDKFILKLVLKYELLKDNFKCLICTLMLNNVVLDCVSEFSLLFLCIESVNT